MKKYAFPAVLKQDEENSAYIKVTFPDLKGATAYGCGRQDAIAAAEELLAKAMEREDYSSITPSKAEDVANEYAPNEVVLVMVEILSDEEIIEKSATKILKKYKRAFEELKDD